MNRKKQSLIKFLPLFFLSEVTCLADPGFNSFALRSDFDPKTKGAFFMAMGGFLITGGILFKLRRTAALRTWLPADADVVGVQLDRKKYRVVTLSYVVYTGERIKVTTQAADWVGLGSSVEIVYNPQSPASIQIASKGANPPEFFMGLFAGLLLILAGWATYGI